MAWYGRSLQEGQSSRPGAPAARPLDPPNGNVEMGDDVTAIKRAMSQRSAGMPWAPSAVGQRLLEAVRARARERARWATPASAASSARRGMAQNGVIDDALYQQLRRIRVPEGPNKGEHIFDAISIALIKLAIAEYGPGAEERQMREAITDFCQRSEADEAPVALHPAKTLLRPWGGTRGDARERLLEFLRVPRLLPRAQRHRYQGARPSKYHYPGFGNTWDDLDGHPRVTSRATTWSAISRTTTGTSPSAASRGTPPPRCGRPSARSSGRTV